MSFENRESKPSTSSKSYLKGNGDKKNDNSNNIQLIADSVARAALPGIAIHSAYKELDNVKAELEKKDSRAFKEKNETRVAITTIQDKNLHVELDYESKQLFDDKINIKPIKRLANQGFFSPIKQVGANGSSYLGETLEQAATLVPKC